MILHRELGEGLAMTPVHPWLVDGLFAAVDGSREHLRRWLPWVEGSTSPDSTRVFIEESLSGLAEKRSIIWAILVDGAPRGVISFFEMNWQTRRAQVGYWLASDVLRRGIMTRCVAELERLGFDDLGLEKVEIHCAVENRASRGIPEKLGYREEGIIRRAEDLYGSVVDHVVYGKLRSEREAGGAVD